MLGSGTNHLVSSLCAGTDVYRQFGLRHPLVVQLLEQLPNSEKCSGYHFTYHHPEKLSSWQATVSSFMACSFSLCFTPFSWPSHPPSHPFPSSPPPFPRLPSSSFIPPLPFPSSPPPSPFFLPSLPLLPLSPLQRAAFNPSGSARTEPFCG